MYQTAKFQAKDDQGGLYEILEFQNTVDGTALDSPCKTEVKTTKSLRTRDGVPVTRIAKGEYQIIGHPNITVRSDDPNAP